MADVFRTYQTPQGTVYEVDGNQVTKEEYDSMSAEAKQQMLEAKTKPTAGFEDLESEFAERMRRSPGKKPVSRKYGGSLKSKVSTHQRSKKASQW